MGRPGSTVRTGRTSSSLGRTMAGGAGSSGGGAVTSGSAALTEPQNVRKSSVSSKGSSRFMGSSILSFLYNPYITGDGMEKSSQKNYKKDKNGDKRNER